MKTTASGPVGLLQRLILSFTSIIPCFFAFGSSKWLIYAVWAVLGGARLRYGDHKALQDSLLFGIFNILLVRRQIYDALISSWIIIGKDTQSTAIASAASTLAIAGLWYISGKSNTSWEGSPELSREGTRPWPVEHPQPFVIPCRTTHTRIFPKKHSFAYGYLLCGFPIVPAGTTPEGIDIADGKDQVLGRWWLQIQAGDYLTRGQAALGFYGKLKVFLREKVKIMLILHDLLTISGRQGFGVVLCLLGNSATLFRLFIQPCVILVHLRSKPPTHKNDHRGE